MTTRDYFHAVMRERRAWPRGSADWRYRTEAARKLYWIIRGVPALEWDARLKELDQ